MVAADTANHTAWFGRFMIMALVSAANVALLSCMYVLLCKFILVTVQMNIHSFIHRVMAPAV